MDIREILNNPNNFYLGHGTGRSKKSVGSIMRSGLRCSHDKLYFTTIPFGYGNQIDNSINYEIRHWKHLDSKEIVIVSVPVKYCIPLRQTFMDGYEAFNYVPSKEQIEDNPNIMFNNYLMPEFVMGYYDVEKDAFIYNNNYYENLSKEEQEKLLQKIKENYFDIVNYVYGIDNYIEKMKKLNFDFPLSDDEVIEFKRKYLIKEIIGKIDEGKLNETITLKDGSNMLFVDYLNKYVFPVLPLKNFIVLNNGIKFPITHFLLEHIYYDCIVNYDTDVTNYLKENINLEETNKIEEYKDEEFELSNIQL